jgi:S1-C subfamily serine protease
MCSEFFVAAGFPWLSFNNAMCFYQLSQRAAVSLFLFTALAAGESNIFAAAPENTGGGGAPENSVVKIFASIRYPDLYKPWAKQAAVEVVGAGVVIEGKRILCTAYNVLYASQVQIQGNQSGDRVAATVEFAAPGINLAVLKLDDEKFFDTHPALARSAKLPAIKQGVAVYGYPEAGNNLGDTKAAVAHIEFAPYSSSVGGLRIQVDRGIDPGSSGGPAIADGKMIGLAFTRTGAGETTGYLIPADEIDYFLQDIADGHYDGKPAMWDDIQSIENPALRTFLKLDSAVRGVIVRKPDKADADYPLKAWDVITKIGDAAVDDQGMVTLEGNLRVRFHYLVQKTARQGKVPLTVIRAGKELQVSVPVSTQRPLVIPELDGSYPPYFIYGPLVFTTASSQFLNGLTRDPRTAMSTMTVLAALGSPLVMRIADKQAFPGERLVVVASPFLSHKVSVGYSNPAGLVVKSVNGTPIKNLNHLVEVLRDCKDEFVAIEFDARLGETPVFRRTDMLKATDAILADSSIRDQGSPDTLAIWHGKP